MAVNEKKRYQSIDFWKGICCIAVVFIHYNFEGRAGIALKTVCRFAVPFFFAVSGYFCVGSDKRFHYEATIRKIKHIVSVLICAGIFYALFNICWNYLMKADWNIFLYTEEKLEIGKVIKLLVTNDPLVYSHLWFMLALIYCYVTILPFNNRKCPKWIWAPCIILMISFSALTELQSLTGLRNSVHIAGSEEIIIVSNLYIFRAMPFFLLGTWFRLNQSTISKIHVSKMLLLGIMVLGSILSLFERYVFIEVQFYIGTYLVVVSMFIFSLLYPDFGNKTIIYIGQRLSMYVYILHIAVGKIMDLVVAKNHLYENAVIKYTRAVIVLLCSLAVAFLIDSLFVKCKNMKENK